MPVTVKIAASGTRQQAFIVPDATATGDGVMTKSQVTKLISLPPGNKPTWNIVGPLTPPDSYDAQPGDLITFDPQTGGIMGITLPDATTCKGQKVGIKDMTPGGATEQIKISTVDGQTIDGVSTGFPAYKLSNIVGANTLAQVHFVSDGANWLIGAIYSRAAA